MCLVDIIVCIYHIYILSDIYIYIYIRVIKNNTILRNLIWREICVCHNIYIYIIRSVCVRNYHILYELRMSIFTRSV